MRGIWPSIHAGLGIISTRKCTQQDSKRITIKSLSNRLLTVLRLKPWISSLDIVGLCDTISATFSNPVAVSINLPSCKLRLRCGEATSRAVPTPMDHHHFPIELLLKFPRLSLQAIHYEKPARIADEFSDLSRVISCWFIGNPMENTWKTRAAQSHLISTNQPLKKPPLHASSAVLVESWNSDGNHPKKKDGRFIYSQLTVNMFLNR